MTLSPEEKAANRAAFRAMDLPHKAEYIFAYYKLPLVLALVVLVAVGSVVNRMLTEKDAVLYAAFVNVEPPDAVDDALTGGFVASQGLNARTSEVSCYRELYLAEAEGAIDQRYAYASRLKLMGAVEAEQLDVTLMNQSAYELLSASGYLMDLEDALADDPALFTKLQPHLMSGTVVLDDNRIEVELGEEDTYEATTETHVNAVDVTTLPILAGFSGNEPLYLGIIANTPRFDAVSAYLSYLLGAQETIDQP